MLVGYMHKFLYTISFLPRGLYVSDGAGDGIPDSEPAREMDISDPRGSVFEL